MCTERKATGEYVLACCLFATMSVHRAKGDRFVRANELPVRQCKTYEKRLMAERFRFDFILIFFFLF